MLSARTADILKIGIVLFLEGSFYGHFTLTIYSGTEVIQRSVSTVEPEVEAK